MHYNGTRSDEFSRYKLEINSLIAKEVNQEILIGHNANYEICDSSFAAKLKMVLIELLKNINLKSPPSGINRFVSFNSISTNLRGVLDVTRLHEVSMTFNANEFINKHQKNYRLDTSDREKFFTDITNSVISIGPIKSELSNLYMRRVYDRECVYSVNPMFSRLTLSSVKGLVITMEIDISINGQMSTILVEAITDYNSIREFSSYVKRACQLFDNHFLLSTQLAEKKNELEDTFYCDPCWKQLKLDYPDIINGLDSLNTKLQKEVFNLGFDTTRVLKYAQSIKEYHNFN
jgi:hypothetical protein